MTHTRLLPALLILVAACSGGSDAGTGGGAGAAVGTADTDMGTVLVDAEGNALYLFTNDTGATSTCTADCATNWPAFVTDGDPVAEGDADAALLGTSEREDGGLQVTYDGHPLYYFSGDEAPGDLNGHEVGDVWYLVTPEGEQVEAAEAARADDGY